MLLSRSERATVRNRGIACLADHGHHAPMIRRLAALAVLMATTSCSTVVHQPKWKSKVATASGKEVIQVTSTPPKMQKWNPVWWLGNIDTPEPPPDYKPDDPHRIRRYQWRNPGHNFTFYVIGIADKEFFRVGRHPEEVFKPGGGTNWAMSFRGIHPPLPFVSYQGRHCSTYFGWRERGNFGAKLNLRWRGVEPK